MIINVVLVIYNQINVCNALIILEIQITLVYVNKGTFKFYKKQNVKNVVLSVRLVLIILLIVYNVQINPEVILLNVAAALVFMMI